jgi:succinyl-CoA synthetase beta subunit
MPVVVRMEGTNVDLGKRRLAESGLNFTPAEDMGTGAARAVELARGRR